MHHTLETANRQSQILYGVQELCGSKPREWLSALVWAADADASGFVLVRMPWEHEARPEGTGEHLRMILEECLTISACGPSSTRVQQVLRVQLRESMPRQTVNSLIFDLEVITRFRSLAKALVSESVACLSVAAYLCCYRTLAGFCTVSKVW